MCHTRDRGTFVPVQCYKQLIFQSKFIYKIVGRLLMLLVKPVFYQRDNRNNSWMSFSLVGKYAAAVGGSPLEIPGYDLTSTVRVRFPLIVLQLWLVSSLRSL